MEVNHHVLNIELEFRYAPWIFGKITGFGLSKLQRWNSFTDSFPKRLPILTWFLACKSNTMIYRSSLSFVTLHQFLAKLRALDLINFSNRTVFQTFFLNANRYWPDIWHVSQSPWFIDRVTLHWFLVKLLALKLNTFQQSNSFPNSFPKPLQILTWFWTCKSITMIYRSSLSFVTLHWFLAKSWTLDLVNFSDQTVFWSFFLNACRYWADFWHVSQSSWLTHQVGVSLHLIDFSQN